MNFKINTLLLVLACGCGMEIKGLESLENAEVKGDIKTDLPSDIMLGPDFEKAAQTCNDFYGVGTEDAADCFEDFRDFYKTTIGFDFSGLIEFCEERYDSELEIDACQDELLDIIGEQNFEAQP